MKQLSRMGPVAAASLIMIGGIGLSCTPPVTIRNDKTQPAYVKPPKNSLGQIDFAEFDKRLKPYRYGKSHPEDRPCSSGPNCGVRITVEEIGNSWEINPERGPGQFQVIGLWENLDNDVEARYNLRPKATYYVWVDQAKQPSAVVKSNTVWGILERGGSAPVTLGYVIKCHPNGSNNKSSELGFSYCPASPTRDYPTMRSNSSASSTGVFSFVTGLFKKASLAASAAGESWFECDPGCCTGTTVAQ